MARFYRGKAEYFNKETHLDGLYFATDINELYLSLKNSEGVIITRTYGSNDNCVKNIDLNEDGSSIVITKQTGDEIELSISDLIKASAANDGLMSSADKV